MAYGMIMKAAGFLASLVLPFLSGGCPRYAGYGPDGLTRHLDSLPAASAEAPPEEARPVLEPVETPAATGRRIEMMLFKDYDGDGRPDMLAFDDKICMLAYLTGGNTRGEKGWLTNIPPEELGIDLYDFGDRAEDPSFSGRADAVRTAFGDIFGGRHPSFKEDAIVMPPGEVTTMSAKSVRAGEGRRPVYVVSVTDGSTVGVADRQGDGPLEIAYSHGGKTLEFPGRGEGLNFLRWKERVRLGKEEGLPGQRYSPLTLLTPNGQEMKIPFF